MIIEGGPAGDVGYWIKHLQRKDTNEQVHIRGTNGTLAQDVEGALREMQAVASGSRSRGDFMYQANINPLAHEHLTPEQWQKAVETLEKNLGLEDHQRIVIEHVKDGRQHYHVVWNRVDVDTMLVRDIGGNFFTHERTARRLEQEFGLERAPRVHGEREGERVSKRTDLWEYDRGHKSGHSPKAVKAEVTALWRGSDSGLAFVEALEMHGYILTKGDGRDFCFIDRAGDEHSLARRLEGVTARQLKARLSGIDREKLPTVAQGKELHKERARERGADRSASAPEVGRDNPILTKTTELEILFDIAKLTVANRTDNAVLQDSEPSRDVQHGGLENDARTRQPDTPQPSERNPEAAPKWVPTPEFSKAQDDVRAAWDGARGNGARFIAGLEKRGYVFACVSTQEAVDSLRQHEEAKAQGKYASRFTPGECVFVHKQGQTYRINGGVTGDLRERIKSSLESIDLGSLPTREEAREQQRAARNPGRDAGGGVELAGEVIGIVVLDPATKATQKLGSFIGSLLAGLVSTPQPKRTAFEQLNESAAERVDRIKAGRRSDGALENIREDLARGSTIAASDVRSLAPGHLQEIMQKGDAGLLAIVKRMEEAREQERDQGRGRER